MFISSRWNVKEPTHYLRRVAEGVPSVVAVLFSLAEVAGLAVMSLKRLMMYEGVSQNKGIFRVLEYVDVELGRSSQLGKQQLQPSVIFRLERNSNP